jgi:DNA replication licensing factor MCM6
LAAANPIGGRYDPEKSLQENTGLTSPIISRFDLMFILIDVPNKQNDRMIANKILNVHRNADVVIAHVYRREDVIRYINIVRKLEPILTDEANKLLKNYYCILRNRGGIITVRQLESMIRLSEATAKMECSSEVLTRHVEIAYQLLNASFVSTNKPPIFINDAPPIFINDAPPIKKSKLMLTRQEYADLSGMVIKHIKVNTGITRAALINWYINQSDDPIESKLLIECIIERLITYDKVLISTGDDALLVVHLNENI